MEIVPETLERVGDPERQDLFRDILKQSLSDLFFARRHSDLDLAVAAAMSFERTIAALLREAYPDDRDVDAYLNRSAANKKRASVSDEDIIKVMTKHKGNVTAAADELGITRQAVYKRFTVNELSSFRTSTDGVNPIT